MLMPKEANTAAWGRHPSIWAAAGEVEDVDLQSDWPPAHAAALRVLEDQPWTDAAVSLAVERVRRGDAADAVVQRHTHPQDTAGGRALLTVSHTWVATAPERGEGEATGGGQDDTLERRLAGASLDAEAATTGTNRAATDAAWHETQWARWEDVHRHLEAQGLLAEASALHWAIGVRAV